jgi:hypothetical protein
VFTGEPGARLIADIFERVDQMGPLKMFSQNRPTPKPKAITESLEFHYAIKVYQLVENYVNMRVKYFVFLL